MFLSTSKSYKTKLFPFVILMFRYASGTNQSPYCFFYRGLEVVFHFRGLFLNINPTGIHCLYFQYFDFFFWGGAGGPVWIKVQNTDCTRVAVTGTA